jgi:hypothetical protein
MREPTAGLCALVTVLGSLAAQQANGRLEGLVLDPLSQPVANAAVQVEVEGEVVARTQTDGQGTFVVGRLPARAVVVRATTPAPDLGALEVDLDAEPRAFVHVWLMPSRRVTGTVRDTDGTPVPGAWVAFAPTGSLALTPVGAHTTTDAHGAFVFAAVPFSRNLLRAWAEGHAGAALELDGIGTQHVDIVLPRDDVPEMSFELAHATHAQRAAATLVVAARCLDVEVRLPPALRRPALAADGRWWLRGWPEGDTVLARLQLPAATIEPSVVVVQGDSVRRQRQFFVEDPSDAVFRGRLVGERGASAAGVCVVVRADDSGSPGVEVTTDEHGTFEVPSPVGLGRHLRLRIADPDLTLQQNQARRSPGEPLADVLCKQRRNHVHVLALRPAATVRATLLDALGQPWRGADVRLLRAEHRAATRRVGQGPMFRVDLAAVLAEGRTDAHGAVRLPRLALDADDDVVLQVSGLGGFLEHRFLVTGGSQDLGSLRAQPQAQLHGRATLSDGTAAAGARMLLQNHNGGMRTWLVTADRDGRFDVLGLCPGPCLVSFLGYGSPQQLVTLAAGETSEVRVRLP